MDCLDVQVVREVLPSGACLRLNIDATSIGNVARFFNHRSVCYTHMSLVQYLQNYALP